MPDPVTTDTIMRQASWVRQFARSLVADASQVDDIVQEAWLASLRHPPRSPEKARPWLRSVMSHTASRIGKRRRLRVTRERISARPESLPSTAELVERASLIRTVVAEVERLAEPYRTTVLLRYMEGLDSTQIAQRQGVAPGTVRARLKRGLDKVRDRMSRRFGDGWRRILIPVLPIMPPSTSCLGGLGIGAIALGTKYAVAATGLALVLVLGFIFLVGSGISDPVQSRKGGKPSLVPGGPEKKEPEIISTTPFGNKEEVPQGRPQLRGRVLDESGAVIAGAQVLVFPPGLKPVASLAASGLEDEVTVRDRTDDQGLFAVKVTARTRAFTVCASAPGCSPAWKRVVLPAGPVELLLRRGSRFVGRAIDREGTPVRNVLVRWTGLRSGVFIQRETRSAADGSFEIVDLPSGSVASRIWNRVFIEACSEGFSPLVLSTQALKLPVPETGETLSCDLVLTRGAMVRGRILDGSTRLPIAGASVSFRSFVSLQSRLRSGDFREARLASSIRPETTSAADGGYELASLPARGIYRNESNVAGQVVGRIVASAEGYCAASVYVPPRQDGATLELDLACWPAGRIEGRVLDSSGAPHANAIVWASALDLTRSQVKTRSDPLGRYVLAGVPARPGTGAQVSLSVNPAGSETLRSSSHARVSVSVLPGKTAKAPDLVLDPLPRVRLLVRDVDGRSVPGARGRVHLSRETRPTDRAGRTVMFFTPGSGDQTVPLAIVAPGFGPTVLPSVRPSVFDPPLALVTLREALQVGGRVVWKDGQPATGIEVLIADGHVPVEQALPKGKTHAQRPSADPWSAYRLWYTYDSVTTSSSGEFRFDELPIGPFHVAAIISGGVRAPGGSPRRRVLPKVSGGDMSLIIDLGMRPLSPATAISGVVRSSATGKRVTSFSATLTRESDWRWARYPTVGHFAFDGVPPGTWVLTVRSKGYVAETRTLHLTGKSEVPVRITLRRGGTVRGRIRAEPGVDLTNVSVMFYDPETNDRLRAPVQADGSFEAAGFAPGRYRMLMLYPNMGPWGRALGIVAPPEVQVSTGQLTELADISVATGAWLNLHVVQDERISSARRSRLLIIDDHGIVIWEWVGVGGVTGHSLALAPGPYKAVLTIDGTRVLQKRFRIMRNRRSSITLKP